MLHPGTPWSGRGDRCQTHCQGAQPDFRPRKNRRFGSLENTAGQGTCLGHQIRHLADIFEKVKQPERLGVSIRHGTFFCRWLRHPQTQGLGCRNRRGGKNDRAGSGARISPERLEDGSLFPSRPTRPHRPRVDRIVNDARFTDTPACLETLSPRPARGRRKPEHAAFTPEKAARPKKTRLSYPRKSQFSPKYSHLVPILNSVARGTVPQGL